MMTGLGVLKIYGFFLRQIELHTWDSEALSIEGTPRQVNRSNAKPFDIFTSVRRAEWDTLMFFYGVILCVGGLGALGYLTLVAELMYIDLGPTSANILVGLLSAIVDNIPVMFAVLTMEPHMSLGQWLLVTLTAGVGGSLLSVGSAAGVALMGQARGIYTFFSHLKWSWAVALGYVASIWTHMLINSSLM
jgi:Na+/H+ antiporter NhaD/arsenite permease-like protein